DRRRRPCAPATSRRAAGRILAGRRSRTARHPACNPPRAMGYRILTAAIGVAACIGTRAAHAQSAEAEALFTEADKLMKAGETARACEAFEGSNRLEPRAGTLIRLGECRERTGELASAWSAYKDALTRVRDPKKRSIASARLAAIEPRLAYLTVAVP